jgi:hypothetical protein
MEVLEPSTNTLEKELVTSDNQFAIFIQVKDNAPLFTWTETET